MTGSDRDIQQVAQAWATDGALRYRRDRDTFANCRSGQVLARLNGLLPSLGQRRMEYFDAPTWTSCRLGGNRLFNGKCRVRFPGGPLLLQGRLLVGTSLFTKPERVRFLPLELADVVSMVAQGTRNAFVQVRFLVSATPL